MTNSTRRGISTRRLTMNAVFIALHVVLDFASIYIGNEIKLSFASFPLLCAAMLFGTADGIYVAGIGEFIYQLLMYGLGPTTLLWMLPPMLHALIAGLLARRFGHEMGVRQVGITVLISGLIAALLTTLVIYIDAQVWGYPSGLTAAMIGFRLLNTLIMCAIYTAIVPKTIVLLRRVYKPRAEKAA